ncbi:hypothetical protein CTM93_03545 [Photobacterium phosphoreum]|nr:hypothetical protein CTM93_03545 [Photobacterium phosphoreum]
MVDVQGYGCPLFFFVVVDVQGYGCPLFFLLILIKKLCDVLKLKDANLLASLILLKTLFFIHLL